MVHVSITFKKSDYVITKIPHTGLKNEINEDMQLRKNCIIYIYLYSVIDIV